MRKKGFTLIELLVVIAIIGMLAGIVLVSLGSARMRARDARRMSDIRQISLAMELFYDSQTPSGYPNLPNIATVIPAASSIGSFLNPVPLDPLSAAPNQYWWTDTDTPLTNYCAWARLEAPAVATYFLASAKGTRTVTTLPDATNCKTL